jgi:ABC-2 type transport system ATP-binding protein
LITQILDNLKVLLGYGTVADLAIEATELVREFKNGPRAVDRIDLAVSPGEIYGFLGPNGAGKSTTVHMLTTLLPPTSGTARVAGHDVVSEGPAVRAAIGAALQEAALDPLLTGREHLRLQASLQALPRVDRKQRADELLERVGLVHAADRKVRGYSGGMKRRLDLAMALVHRPAVLFLDEPTTGLDIQSRTALWEEVARLAREDRVTVFLTTQYLEEADVLADRVGIIDHGRIVAEGTPAELKAQVGRPTVEAIPADPEEAARAAEVLGRFGDPCGSTKGVAVRLRTGETDLAGIVRALDGENIKVENLQLHQPSLDDVFLAKTGRSLEGEEEPLEPPRGGIAAEPARMHSPTRSSCSRAARSCERSGSRRTSSRRCSSRCSCSRSTQAV